MGVKRVVQDHSEERQGCIMSPWLLNAYMDAVLKEVKMRMGRMGESENCLASCRQMNWFCVVSQRKT